MGYRRHHRSSSRDESPERSSGSRSKTSLEPRDDATTGGGDATSSSGTHHRSSSSRHHHRSHRSDRQHSEGRPRRRRERPEWLKLILRAQRQFVGAILMTVGLCLSRGAQLVSAMLLGPRAQPVEERPRERPSGNGDPVPSAAPSTSTTLATRSYAPASNYPMTHDDFTPNHNRAIVPPEDLD